MTDRRDLSARLLEALPPRALQALMLARAFAPGCDAADAWLKWASCPMDSVGRLAASLRSDDRRARRDGGAHGPARFVPLPVDFEVGTDLGDPLLILQAVETASAIPGIEDEIKPAAHLNARRYAGLWGVGLRRAQQILRGRRRDSRRDQRDLFGGEGESC